MSIRNGRSLQSRVSGVVFSENSTADSKSIKYTLGHVQLKFLREPFYEKILKKDVLNAMSLCHLAPGTNVLGELCFCYGCT